MFSRSMRAHLEGIFVPKIVAVFGSLEELYSKVVAGKYTYNRLGDRCPQEEVDAAIAKSLEGAQLTIQIEAVNESAKYPDPLEYNTTGAIRINLLNKGVVVANLFSCFIRGTQYNCGLKELVRITTLFVNPDAQHGQKTTPVNEQIVSIAFDIILEAMQRHKEMGYKDRCDVGYQAGQLLMSHDAGSYVTRVAVEHPMWREIFRSNNPNYGGSKHEYVLFSANIMHEAIYK